MNTETRVIGMSADRSSSTGRLAAGRRRLLVLAAASAGMPAVRVAAQTAGAADYPNRPVRVVVPYPPGGPADFPARVAQAELQRAFGKPVVIDNRGGASGTIGTAQVARADPDGYTLLWGGIQTHATNLGVLKNLPYDAFTDFTPITRTTRTDWMLAVSPRLGVATPGSWAELVRSQPGKRTYGSSGSGSAGHLGFALLARHLGLDLVHVPYKGTLQAVNDVMAGEVDMVMADQSVLLPFIREKRLVPIAMAGAGRSRLVPDYPTLAETIAPGFVLQSWQGIWGPAGLPADIVAKVHAAFAAAFAAPDVVRRLVEAGSEPGVTSPAAFDAFVREEAKRWIQAARDANITPE